MPREHVSVAGTVVAITFPAQGTNRQAYVYLKDPTGTLVITWSGRTNVPDITVGSVLRVEGLPTQSERQMIMQNPSYERITEREL